MRFYDYISLTTENFLNKILYAYICAKLQNFIQLPLTLTKYQSYAILSALI